MNRARGFQRLPLRVLTALLFAGCAATLSAAPRALGPNKCTSCHTHEKQGLWASKDTHARALQQLEEKNAGKYARAVGLPDPYSLTGPCVACHATVFNGDANAGVSCETCHGAGSDYLEPHQEKGAYAKAVTLGMLDTRRSYTVWAKLCVACHLVTDKKLTAAGHPPGANFEPSAASQKIVHWDASYDWTQLAAAGKAAAGSRAGGQIAARPEARSTAIVTTKPRVPAVETPAPPAKPSQETPPPVRRAPEVTSTPAPEVKLPSRPARELTPTTSRATAAPRPVSPSPTAEIAILIEATPIATPTPLALPPEIPVATLAPTTSPARSPSPTRTLRRPAPRKPVHRASPRPSPTPTPTKRPGPVEPPRRAPH